MPQRPSHRLNLYLVPQDCERRLELAALTEARASWLHEELVLPDGAPGPQATRLIPGGFALLRVDQPLGGALYGNRQGGFYVECPACGVSVARGLSGALRAWQDGGAGALACPECGVTSALSQLRYRPDAAPARFAVELRDVESLTLTPWGELLLRAFLGPLRLIPSRGG